MAALLLATGCASSNAGSRGNTTPRSNSGPSSGSTSSKGGDTNVPVEQEVNVTLKPNTFPPVDAGAWVCEPKTWADQTVLVHCTAPAGSTGLVDSIKQLPQVVDAVLAK